MSLMFWQVILLFHMRYATMRVLYSALNVCTLVTLTLARSLGLYVCARLNGSCSDWYILQHITHHYTRKKLHSFMLLFLGVFSSEKMALSIKSLHLSLMYTSNTTKIRWKQMENMISTQCSRRNKVLFGSVKLLT